jgi:sodium/proline symporter
MSSQSSSNRESQMSVELSFLGIFLLLMLVHAWHGARKTNSLSDYLVGGRSLGGVGIALSFFATFVSSVTFVGLAGRSWTLGPAWWIVCTILFTAAIAVSWFVVAPRILEFANKFHVLTIPELLGARYQSRALQRMSGVVVVVASLVYMTAVYDGAARTLEGLLKIDSQTVMALVFVVVTGYTLMGGFRAVVATDGVQGVMLLCGAVTLPVAMLYHGGGIAQVLDTVQERAPRALDLTTGLPLLGLVGTALGIALKILVDPRLLSRFYGLSSLDQVKRGRWLAVVMLFATYLFVLPVGLLAHAFVPDGMDLKTDEVVPWLLSSEGHVLGTVAGSLFLTALVAAAMSSLDSVLLVAAGSIERDIGPQRHDSAESVRRTRVWVFVLSAVAASLALMRTRGIVELSSLSGSLFATCFLPTLIVGIFWQGATKTAATWSLVSGFVTAATWFGLKKVALGGSLAWLHEIYVGLLVSMPVFIGVSIIQRRSNSEST